MADGGADGSNRSKIIHDSVSRVAPRRGSDEFYGEVYAPPPLHRNAKPICEALCPATKTEIFSGSEIAQATSADGSPYQKLANAFVYRERIVPGCTCNGHDELGIASMKIEDDPTLEPGDLIATKNRLVPFRTWRKEPKYTPIEKDATQGRKESAPTVTKKNVSIIVRSPQGPSPTNAAVPVGIPAQQW